MGGKCLYAGPDSDSESSDSTEQSFKGGFDGKAALSLVLSPSKHISSALSVTSPHPFNPSTHAFHTACCEKQACCVAQPWRQTLSRLQAAPPAPTVSPSPSPCSQMTYKTLASHTNLTLTARHELSNCAIES